MVDHKNLLPLAPVRNLAALDPRVDTFWPTPRGEWRPGEVGLGLEETSTALRGVVTNRLAGAMR